MADNAAGNQRGRQFQKGQSGNPSGKPPGTRARVTVLGEKIMQDEADAIVQSVVQAAKNGDPTAMRLCVERLIPVRKGRRSRLICRTLRRLPTSPRPSA